jgi:8-oxo-dGTP diphosphatase
LRRDGRILLTRQSTPDLEEVQLPGGGIDPGEAPLPALVREVFEETGWTCRPERWLGAYRRFTWMPEYQIWAEKVCHVFLARPGLRLGEAPEAGHRALWVPEGVAGGMLANDGDREFLREALAGAGGRQAWNRRPMQT